MPDIEGLQFKIEGDAENAILGLNALKNTLMALKNATNGGAEGLSKVADGLSKLNAVLKDVKNVSEVKNLANALGRLSKLKLEDFANSAAGLKSIISEVETVSDDQISRLERFSKALSKVSKNTHGIGNIVPVTTNTSNNAPSNPVTDEPKDAGAEERTIDTSAWERFSIVLAKVKSALSGAVSGVKSLGDKVKTAGKHVLTLTKGFAKFYSDTALRGISSITKLGGAFAGLFKKIGRIALLKGIRSAISALTAGFSEGLSNLYQYSKALDGRFAKSMDTLATNGLYLKNSLAAMASPIINAIAPAVDFVTGKIVTLYNMINQVFAKLSGSSTYTVAKKVAKTYKDVGDTTTKSVKDTAKAIKKTILSFDELHVMNGADNSSTGSGSGSGTDGIDYSTMFETKNVSGRVSDFVQSIKDAISQGDWRGVGAILGRKFNEAVDSIDWGKLGTTIGEWISRGVETLYGFLSSVDFRNLGSKITELANKTIGSVNWNTVGRYLIKRFTVLGDLLIGFIKTLDVKGLAKNVSDTLIGMFDETREWFNSVDFVDLGNTIYQKLKDGLANIKFAEIAKGFFGAIGSAFGAAFDLLSGVIGGIASDIKTYFDENIKGANWKETGLNILSFICEGFMSINDFIVNNLIAPFVSAIIGEDAWESVKTAGSVIVNNIGQGIIDFFTNPIQWLKNVFKSLIDAICGETVWAGIEEGGQSLMGQFAAGIDAFLSDPIGFIKTHVFDPLAQAIADSPPVKFFAELKNDAAKWWSNAKKWWKDKVGKAGGLKKIAADIKDNAATLWSKFRERWKIALEKVDPKKIVADIKDNAATLWSKFRGWWSTALGKTDPKKIVAKLKDNASTLWSNFKTWWSRALDGGGLKKVVAKLKDNASSLWSNLRTWWSRVTGTGRIGNVFAGITNNVGTLWRNLRTWWNNTVGTLWVNVRTKVRTALGMDNNPSVYPLYQAKGAILDGATVYGMAGNHPLIGGEAGKEAVLPLESHTEWMDTLAQKVVSALPTQGDPDAIAMSVREGNSAIAQRQMDLLREQNNLLRQLLAKDMSVEVTASDISRAFDRKSRREGSVVMA